jgi:hypothetical protein
MFDCARRMDTLAGLLVPGALASGRGCGFIRLHQ